MYFSSSPSNNAADEQARPGTSGQPAEKSDDPSLQITSGQLDPPGDLALPQTGSAAKARDEGSSGKSTPLIHSRSFTTSARMQW